MHRMLIGLALAGTVCPAARAADWYTGAERPSDPDAWIVAVDASATVGSQGSQFANAQVTAAPAGDLLTSGFRMRVDGLIGSYRTEGSGGARAVGSQADVAGMAGYAMVWQDAVLAGFVGLNVHRNELSRLDASLPFARTEIGLKAALDFYARPTVATMVHATGSYSTAANAYYARLRFGYAALAGGYIGPEITALGDDTYRQWRFGAHLSAVQFGALQFGLSGGYVHDASRRAGFYTTVDMRAGF